MLLATFVVAHTNVVSSFPPSLKNSTATFALFAHPTLWFWYDENVEDDKVEQDFFIPK